MNIVLDNIIFSLQKSGGITVVWKEFLTRLCVIPKLNIYLINYTCLLYTSDAADDLLCVNLGGTHIIKKKKKQKDNDNHIEPQSIVF